MPAKKLRALTDVTFITPYSQFVSSGRRFRACDSTTLVVNIKISVRSRVTSHENASNKPASYCFYLRSQLPTLHLSSTLHFLDLVGKELPLILAPKKPKGHINEKTREPVTCSSNQPVANWDL
ncbi:hypothetical protein TNCV_4370811 [Trichonephila clavipes]|uniref:Uncharacterized protein n=1 Tax=Trichonephila clavipes TaxID=2585209 RepID=A0A8X6V5H4_TRICX|nr:hypothetical protein TNCV_4370811 [Trichonephila clavipes]